MTPSPKNSPNSEDAPATQRVGQGRYVILGSLGAGSQGETLEALDERNGCAVAIKRFTMRGAKSWKDVELAEREATVLASLNHPSLPRYIEHFEENDALYLVMEKVDGESLAARRRRNVPLSQEQVLRFLRDAAVSLAYLHGHAPPIVHRDIKPSNVILRGDGSYCLVDFGSVRDRLKPEGGSTVVGTFGFMAPEQFQGRAGPGSDVYAVGATALSLLAGREPEALPHRGLAIDVEAALRGQVDRKLIAALVRMLEPDPDRRAASVAVALQVAGISLEAGPGRDSRPAEAAKQARRARLEAEAGRSPGTVGRKERHQSRYERHVERNARREAERADRKARMAERREERHSRRYANRPWRRPGPPVPPGIVLGIVVLVALQLARVATFALFQVLLPTLFTLIPKPGRRERMLEIGQAGQRGLRTASRHIRHQFLGGPAPPGFEAFVGEPAAATSDERDVGPAAARSRQRVSVDAVADEPEATAEKFEARAEERRRRER